MARQIPSLLVLLNMKASKRKTNALLLRSKLKEALRELPPEQNDIPPEDYEWGDVLYELVRAKEESDERGKKAASKFWRGLATSATIAEPALDGIPDEVAVLRGALAVVLRVSFPKKSRQLCGRKRYDNKGD